MEDITYTAIACPQCSSASVIVVFSELIREVGGQEKIRTEYFCQMCGHEWEHIPREEK